MHESEWTWSLAYINPFFTQKFFGFSVILTNRFVSAPSWSGLHFGYGPFDLRLFLVTFRCLSRFFWEATHTVRFFERLLAIPALLFGAVTGPQLFRTGKRHWWNVRRSAKTVDDALFVVHNI